MFWKSEPTKIPNPIQRGLHKSRTSVIIGMQRISWSLHAMLLYAVVCCFSAMGQCLQEYLTSKYPGCLGCESTGPRDFWGFSRHHITNGDYCLIPHQICKGITSISSAITSSRDLITTNYYYNLKWLFLKWLMRKQISQIPTFTMANHADVLTECISAKVNSVSFRPMKIEAFSLYVSKVFQPQRWH